MREENYREINAHVPLTPKVTNLEQFVVKKQLNEKGRITTLSMAGMLWCFREIETGFQSKTIKCLMATVLFI